MRTTKNPKNKCWDWVLGFPSFGKYQFEQHLAQLSEIATPRAMEYLNETSRLRPYFAITPLRTLLYRELETRRFRSRIYEFATLRTCLCFFCIPNLTVSLFGDQHCGILHQTRRFTNDN